MSDKEEESQTNAPKEETKGKLFTKKTQYVPKYPPQTMQKEEKMAVPMTDTLISSQPMAIGMD